MRSLPHHRLALGIATIVSLVLAGCSGDLADEPTGERVSGTAIGDGTEAAAPTSPATASVSIAPGGTTPEATKPEVAEPLETDPLETDPLETEPLETEPATSGSIAPFAAAATATDEVFAELEPEGPGCTWAVGIDGIVEHTGAVGAASIDPLEPMSTATIVDIGSTSKQFTATAIVLLAQRGELALDDPLATFLTDLPDWSDEVTLRQMIHHTSGIPDYIALLLDAGYGFADVTTVADALDALGQVEELDFPPDDHFEYSNSNYFLLGEVVTAVTGTTLGDFLASEVFGPLDLDMVMDPTAELDGKATSYEWDADAQDWLVADSPWEQTGDGGIQTTPSELVQWAAQWWAPTVGGEAVNEVRLGDSVEADEGVGYGYGMGIYESDQLGTVLTHSGGWAGFVTSFVVLPADHLAVSTTCTAYELDVMHGDVGLDIATIWHDAITSLGA